MGKGGLLELVRGRLLLRGRLMLFFSICIVLPLLIVSIISYFRFSDYAVNITIKSKIDMSKSAMEEIGIIKQRDERISDQIILNKDLQKALYSQNFADSLQQYEEKNNINLFLTTMTDSNNVSGISVLGINGKEYMSKDVDLLSVKDSPDVKKLVNNPAFAKSKGNVTWFPSSGNIFSSPYDTKTLKTNQLYLYLLRKINRLENSKQEIGVCIIQYVYDRLSKVLSNTATGRGEFCILSDGNGLILCNTLDRSQIGKNLDESVQTEVETSQQGSFYNTVKGIKYLMLYIDDKDSGWTIIQGIPYANLLSESRRIRDFTLVTLLMCLLPAMLLSVLFSKNITDPIIRLKRVMDRFASGNLKLRSKTDRNDEIGQLQSSFNYMTEEIESLIEKSIEEQKQRRILELSVLEYQINPHFLYNTLESVNWMAQKAGQKEIGQMVTALARFFRLGLSMGKELITVRDEVEHAYNYLIISKMRYKDCFTFRIDVPEEVNDCRTIKLILQPLVENAIKHGLNKKASDGSIEISGRIEGSKTLLTITDNGRGISSDKLAEIRKTIGGTSEVGTADNGVGLQNVSQRLKLNFGPEYGLDIDSEEGSWTRVTVSFPVLHGQLPGQEPA